MEDRFSIAGCPRNTRKRKQEICKVCEKHEIPTVLLDCSRCKSNSDDLELSEESVFIGQPSKRLRTTGGKPHKLPWTVLKTFLR